MDNIPISVYTIEGVMEIMGLTNDKIKQLHIMSIELQKNNKKPNVKFYAYKL